MTDQLGIRGARPLALTLLTALALTGCGSQSPEPQQAGPARESRGTTTVVPDTSPPKSPRDNAPWDRKGDQPETCATDEPMTRDGKTVSRDPQTPAPDLPADMPPNHADNRSFRRTVPLKGEDLCRARDEQLRVRLALAGPRSFTEQQVRTELAKSGYPGSAVETRTASPGTVTATLTLNRVCIDATAGPAAVSVEYHGVYVEGTGCREPEGGH